MIYENGEKHKGRTRRTFSLRDLLAIGFRRRRLILLSFLATLAGAVAGAFLFAKYESEVKILVQHKRSDPVVTAENNVSQIDRSLAPDELNSEVALLTSRDLLQKVVVDCNLYDPAPWTLGWIELRLLDTVHLAPDKETRIFQAVLKLENDLDAEPLPNTDVIKVVYDHKNPRLAANVLTHLSDLYLEKHVSVHRPGGTRTFFEGETDLYEKALGAAEARLASFNRRSGIVSADFEKQITIQKLTDFEGELRETQANIAQTQQSIRLLEKEAASTPSRQTTQVRNANNPEALGALQSTLLNLELKRTELLTQFQPNHRLVAEVTAEINQAHAALENAEKAMLHEETSDRDATYEWMRSELAKERAALVGLRARGSVLAAAVGAYRTRALHLDSQGLFQQDLLRKAKATEQNFLLYLSKREEARITDALDQQHIVNVAISERATVALVPIGPSLPVKLLLAAVLAVLVSFGLAFAANYFDRSFRTPDELQEFLGVPVLAAIPRRDGH